MIGIFDSGIGGVTIFKEILKDMPNYHYIYYSDSINNPYGDKTVSQIEKTVFEIVEKLNSKGCQIIVIACNTASTVCVEKLRKKYQNISFIATEPAYKMFCDQKPNEKALVLATKMTLDSERFRTLYNKYNNYKTELCHCIGLSEIIEEGNLEKIRRYLQKKLTPFIGIKNIVLGCTHYPLIKKEIREVLGDVEFYDGSKGVSQQLKRKIEQKQIREQRQKIEFYDSSNSKLKENRFFKILSDCKLL